MNELEAIFPDVPEPIGLSIASSSTARVDQRHPFGVEVAWQRPENIIGETVDISAAGFFISTGSPAPPNGSRMKVLIRFGGQRPWREVEVEVRWEGEACGANGPRGFGVRFVALDAAALTDLNQLLGEIARARYFGEDRPCND